MPNKIQFDNINNTLYIRYSSNNKNFILHAINELQNHNIDSVILDIRNATNIDLNLLLNTIKNYNPIYLTNGLTSKELIAQLNSTNIINFDEIPFTSEEEKRGFEENIITSTLRLNERNIDSLQVFNPSDYIRDMQKVFVDLISEEYSEYLPEDKIVFLKNLTPHVELSIIKNLDDIDASLIFNLFQNLINSASTLPAELSFDLTNILAEICMLNFIKKHEILNGYMPKNPNMVIFMKEKLSKLGDLSNIYTLIFNGNIDQIITAISISAEEFVEEYRHAKNHESEYENLIHQIASLHTNVDFESLLMKLSARQDNQVEALKIINESINEMIPEISIQTNTLIEEYLTKNQISLSA